MSMLSLEDLLITRGDEKYAEVAIFMDLLRALAMVHQSAHWQTSGPTFYGDHLLFERLYTETTADVDAVGEKSIGLGSSRLVELRLSVENVKRFVNAIDDSVVPALGMPVGVPTVQKSLKAENAFIKAGETLMEALQKKGQLTRGLENLLGGILDKHEGHVYLLRQRIG